MYSNHQDEFRNKQVDKLNRVIQNKTISRYIERAYLQSLYPTIQR